MRSEPIEFSKILRSHGFKKVPWSRCPQWFEIYNYPCYEHPSKNIWCETYMSDQFPYGWIIGEGIKKTEMTGGSFFDNNKRLRELLKNI